MTLLDASHEAYVSLRAHLPAQLPSADVRKFTIASYGIRIQVGPEVGVPTDIEIRPALLEVARAIDPAAEFTWVESFRNFTYRWLCQWDGVRVVVQGEGRDEPVRRPTPVPLPVGTVAA